MIGKTLAGYEVVEKVGAGGMGEVYRARDPKLGRDVALKILPESVAHDEERLARFEREARLLASLSHANIGAIFGLEQAGGQRFLVLEMVEGDDLSARIAQGPLAVDDALDIALQVAQGLEAAHEQGVVHRDLKPNNIKVTADGKVKVLDFGLAKALDVDTRSQDLSHSPTVMASSPTMAGVILGTAAYMSPEQARGKPVDRRADIWAFGVVLYEMLAGRQLFPGETISDTLAAVIRAEIDLSVLPKDVPPNVIAMLKRCLDRDPATRLRDIGEARIVIEKVKRGETGEMAAPTEAAPVTAGGRGVGIVPWALAAVAIAAAVFFFVRARAPETPLVRAMIPPPEETSFQLRVFHPGPAAMSPDGTRLAFSAVRDGETSLWVRTLDALEPRVVSGTVDAGYPFWSPDGRWIGFFADGKMKRVGAQGEPPLTITDAPTGKGGSWNADGWIVFAPTSGSPIHKVRATGGETASITTMSRDRKENSHRFPQFLPDGEHFIYFARASGQNTIRVGSLDGTADVEVLRSEAQGWYVDGYLLFPREHTLMAQRFDADNLHLVGEAVPVAPDLHVVDGIPCAVFSAAPGGRLVYMQTTAEQGGVVRWLDRTGNELETFGRLAIFGDFQISPDDKKVCMEITESDLSTADLWIMDLETQIRTRFTFDSSDEFDPVWSPDGSEIVFCSNRDGQYDLYRKKVEGSEGEQILYVSDFEKHAYDWSPDGRYVIFQERDSLVAGVWGLDVASGEAFRLTEPGLDARRPYFSPDGRWYVAVGRESGQATIFVQSFPKPGRRWQVSSADGDQPRWGANGKIYYQKRDGMVTEVSLALGTSSVQLLGETPLFDTRAESLYHVDQTGERFLEVLYPSAGAATPLVFVSDWRRGLADKR